MTRKRKIDSTQSENEVGDNKKERSFDYGYQNSSEEGPSTNRDPTQSNNQYQRTFPNKNRGGGGYRGRGGQRNHQFTKGRGRSYDTNDFDRKYGRVGGGNEDEVRESIREEGKGKEEKEPYPAELVAYLKNIEQMQVTEGHLDNMVIDKCAEECTGEEEKLLSFRDSSIVVESVFGSSQRGAELFLTGLARLKHKRLLDLFFSGTSAHAIETLFYALLPIKTNKPVELLEKFSDLLCDNWNDAVGCQHSAFLVRCFAWVACGLKKKDKSSYESSTTAQSIEGQSADIKVGLSRVFDRIASLALESAATPRVENVHLSLVVQDVLEADRVAKLGKSTLLVDKILATATGNDLRQLWMGKNSSRVWEKLVMTCREETLQSLWETIVTGHVSELAAHPSANFPLQNFISSVKSLELATDVCHEATPLIQKFLSSDRWGVAQALLQCAAKHEDLQEPLLKALRQFFRAGTKENKVNFLLNIATMNKYNGKLFNDYDLHLHGCLLLEVLLMFNKIKTLTACLEALQASDIVKLAKNKCGSHVLQAAFKSDTLEESVKEKLINAFEDDWGSLISDVYGSHVFESIWDCSLFTVKRRQELMKKLVPIHNDSKFWKFAMLRCDMYLFRKDRKAWVEKMKKTVKKVKH
ncbi:hypothetical protein V3C99_009649 [Haemonchus contortus]